MSSSAVLKVQKKFTYPLLMKFLFIFNRLQIDGVVSLFLRQVL